MILQDKNLGEIRIDRVERHINGETGEPFHTIAFRSEAGDLVAVLFEEPKHIAILDPNFPSLKFRGDDFEGLMRTAVSKWRRG